MTTNNNRQSANQAGFQRAKIQVEVTPGEMLRTLRELQEMSQNDLARLTGIAQSSLSALENGSRNIGRERALVLAKALKVHPAVILFPNFDSASLDDAAA